MNKGSSTDNSSDSCTLCSTKYHRFRPALCQCKHCSTSFCFDCMKAHHDELQESIGQAVNKYNELKQLYDAKKTLVSSETRQSKNQLTEWYDKFVRDLLNEVTKIQISMDKAELEAQAFLEKIDSKMKSVKDQIEVFTKHNTYYTAQMTEIVKTLDELMKQLASVSVSQDYDLRISMPKYTLTFNLPSKSVSNDNQTKSTNFEQNQEKWSAWGPRMVNEDSQNKITPSDVISDDDDEDTESFYPDEDYFCNREKFELTSYEVNCMASDGINILYSTIEDSQVERVAYCCLDKEDANYRQPDPNRIWHQSRILDMIWWDTIDKFVCGTPRGIYTIEYLNKTFRILNVINSQFTKLCLAANSSQLWLYGNEKIYEYDVNFRLVKNVILDVPRTLKSSSFCLTDEFVAFAFLRGIENNRHVLTIHFYDLQMQRVKRVDLGISETTCIIRTDGCDRFYVATGQQRFYIITPAGQKEIINLGKQANCLAVVNSRSIVLTKSRSDLELVRC